MAKKNTLYIIIFCFIASCSSDISFKHQKSQIMPRLKVSNSNYQEEGLVPIDTGYRLYKVEVFNGQDTICIGTNRGGAYFHPYANAYFLYVDTVPTLVGSTLIDHVAENETTILPFDTCIFYFEHLESQLPYDSVVYFFVYYDKFCIQPKAQGAMESPMVPHW
jgi:hypothetical protein